jgi:hypothetical protein
LIKKSEFFLCPINLYSEKIKEEEVNEEEAKTVGEERATEAEIENKKKEEKRRKRRKK